MTIALYVITALNVLVAAGFAVAGLVRPEVIVAGPQGEAARIFALFAAARTLPLALVALIAIALGALPAIIWLGWLAGLVQLADFVVIGFAQRQWAKAIGPVVIAIAQFAAIILVLQAGA